MYEICTVAGNEVIRAFHKGRIYFALFLNLILIKQLTDSISSFSVAVKVRVTPWVFPFLIGESYIQLIFIAGIVLMFSDAPFVKSISFYEIIRSGKRKWIFGEILYIFLMSIIYTLLVVLLTVLLLFPRLTPDLKWGKVLGTLAQTNAASAFGNSYMSLDYGIMQRYTPIKAMLLSIVLSIIVCFLVGILIMLVNVLQKKIPGAAFGMLVGFFSYFQKNFSNLYRMSFFSPATWMDIGMWNSEIRLSYPTTDYMTGFLFFTISVMLIVSVAAFERSEDIFMKGEENE